MSTKWEYKILDTKSAGGGGLFTKKRSNEEIEAYLNRLGAQGWEIVNMDFLDGESSANFFVGVAKRPRS